MKNERRLSQLERAAKLRANVSVLLALGAEAPHVVELAAVKRTQILSCSRAYVQVMSWIDDRSPVERVVVDSDEVGLTEDQLADAVDRALDAFEARGKRQAAT